MESWPHPAAHWHEERLRRHGVGAEALPLVLDHFAPATLAEMLGERDWLELASRAGEYVERNGVHWLQRQSVDITLVVPPFDSGEMAESYAGAVAMLERSLRGVGGTAASNDGDRLTARSRQWLRAVHQELAVRDFYQLEPPEAAHLPEAGLRDFLEGGCGIESAVRAVDVACLLPEELRKGMGHQVAVVAAPSPLPPGALISLTAGLDLFADLGAVVGSFETALRADAEMAAAERRAHQLVALTAVLCSHLLASEAGRSANLLIELESPPPVAARSVDDFPLIGMVTLRALANTFPAAFGRTRREVDLVKPKLREQWAEVTVGAAGQGHARGRGVVGLLSESAEPAIAGIGDAWGASR